jgi:competence protein ComFC
MLGGLIKGLIEIVYPKSCIACKNSLKNNTGIDDLVCLKCWGKIKKNLPPFCFCCGRHLGINSPANNICPECTKTPLHFDRAFSPCIYEETIRLLIHEFKYRRRDYLGKILSKLMIEFIQEYDLPMKYIDTIIPIPLHKTKQREREFNQSEILSKYIAQKFDKKMLNNALRRHLPTQSQAELKDRDRFKNIKGSFSCARKQSVQGENILLVDDVLTTGATASEAACVLKDAGANIVFVLTLARGNLLN